MQTVAKWPTFQQVLETLLETDRATLTVITLMTGLVIYNVRNFLANPTMCVFITPLVIAISALMFHGLIFLEFTAPNNYNSWLIGSVMATTIGSSFAILVVAMIGRVVEFFARIRRREAMAEYHDPGSARPLS